MLNIETERKFLVKDGSYKDMAVSSHRIIQGYVCKENGRTVRVRISDDRAYLTIKGPSADGISRLEWEMEIAAEDAKDLLPLCQDGLIEKNPSYRSFRRKDFRSGRISERQRRTYRGRNRTRKQGRILFKARLALR